MKHIAVLLAGHWLPGLLLALFMSNSMAAVNKTGFLVIAQDRGHLGNQEIEPIMEMFKQRYTASLALVGKNRQGIEGDYADYIQRAIEALEQQDVSTIVAIPLFVSEADINLANYRDKLPGQSKRTKIHWAPAMAQSYLTAQILLDRVDALSEQPEQERLVVLAQGAVDESSEQQIRKDMEKLLKQVKDSKSFREVVVEVYYDRSADQHQQINKAIDERVIRTAAKRGRTLVVPFAIGVKFDQRMSMEGWMKRKFAEFDIDLGQSLLPHPDVLTWLKQTANRYLSADEQRVAVLVMPHGSTQPYNDGLERVIEPLRKDYRIEMAPGMGDPLILAQAVKKLEQEGATRIIFARMYALQGHMKARTDYILGISDNPPGHHHGGLPPRIRTSVIFDTFGGYEEDPLIAEVLRERILELSSEPEKETVILLAHGTMDEEGNKRWLEVINGNIGKIKRDLPRPFRSIKAMTLREDWPDKRKKALEEIKAEIEKGNQNNGRVLIVSNRLYGSGPYQRLLDGAEFEMNGRGLVPHINMTRWLEKGIRQQLSDSVALRQTTVAQNLH